MLEVQGDFWHVNPSVYPNGPLHDSQRRTLANDARKSASLALLGYDVRYLWESDFKRDPVEALTEALKGIHALR